MKSFRQGELLMLLVKRDERDTKAIADAMGVDKSYLPKLYKMEFLPRKPLQRAVEVFALPADYFSNPSASMVEEPRAVYADASSDFAALQADYKRLQEENGRLQAEIRRLNLQLDEERELRKTLAEALKNLSKRE